MYDFLLANSIRVLTDDRMAHMGLKSQANSSNPLKRVKPLNDRHCRRSIFIVHSSNLLIVVLAISLGF
jgi:hypothetical protein